MPKVSVIIPCYNQGQYVDEAVDSVLAQTFQDFEIIIINDGSTDKITNKKLENYNRPKTKVIYTINQGLSAARNNGIKESVGEYILPLDADDKIGDTFLEKAVVELGKSDNFKAISFGVQFFGEVNTQTTPKGGSILNFLHYNNTTACSLYRRSDYYKVGGYNEAMISGYEDWDYWLRLLKDGGEIKILPDILFFYRKKNDSMLINTEKKHIEIYSTLIKNNIDIFKQNCEYIIIEKEKLLKKRNATLESNFAILNKNYNKVLKGKSGFKISCKIFIKSIIQSLKYK